MDQLRQDGNAAFKAGDFLQAIAKYDAALALCSQSEAHILQTNRSLCNFKLENFDDSLSDATSAILLRPDWAKAWCRKALALQALGSFNESLEAVNIALGLEPKNANFAELRNELEEMLSICTAVPHGNPANPSLAPAHRKVQKCWAPPELRTFSFIPASKGTGSNLLVLLHGLGDSHAPFADFAKKLELPHTDIISIRAPDPLPLDMGHSWYPVFEPNGLLIGPRKGERRRLDGLKRTGALIQTFLRKCWSEGCYQPKSTFMFGFSQGAVVAVHVGAELRLGGVVGVSGSLLEEELSQSVEERGATQASEEGGATPMLLTHGLRDDRAAIDLARRCRDRVMEAAAARHGSHMVTWKEYGKAHEMLRLKAEVDDFMQFMAKYITLPSAPAAGGVPLEQQPDVVEVKDPELIRSVLLGNKFGA